MAAHGVARAHHDHLRPVPGDGQAGPALDGAVQAATTTGLAGPLQPGPRRALRVHV